MITEILSKIWDYLFNLFGHHNTDNPEKFSKQVRWQSIALIVISILLGIALSVLIYCVGINEIPLANKVENGENILYKPTSYAWGMIIAMLFFVWTVSAYAYGVLKDLKPNTNRNLISDPLKDSLQNDVSFLQLKQCERCSNYLLSSSFIINRIEKIQTHSEFVQICKSISRVPPQNLLEIKNYFNSNSSCKLLCLLTNPQYYSPETEPGNLIDLLQYFESFYPLKNKNRRIKRVFNLSALGQKDDTKYQEKKQWMFQYVLMNVLTGVETCVLDDTVDTKLHKLTVDYVVGMATDSSNLYSKRKLFLSYQDHDDEQVLVFEDQLLTNVFEADFYDRLKGNSSTGSYVVKRRREIIDKRDTDKEKIDCKDIKKINEFLQLKNNEMVACVNNMKDVIRGVHPILKEKAPISIDKRYKDELVRKLNDIEKIINKMK